MSEDEGDPFESFEEAEDREGDPFERLGDVEPAESDGESDGESAGADKAPGTPAEGGDDSTTDPDGPTFEEEFIDETDPFASGPDAATGHSPGDELPERAQDDPLVTDGPFDGMEGRESDPFDEAESVFEAVEVESVDIDEVWASLDEDPSTATVAESRYVEVSKHRFCEQCEHFSAPPNAHCTHEEAEIIEFLDMETVRLLNCPVVAEQREIENEE